MSTVKNLIGQKFNKLTVIERLENDKHKRAVWLCKCDCGSEKEVKANTSDLIGNKVKSCGCLKSISLKGKKKNRIVIKYNRYDLSGKYGIGYTHKGEEFYFDLEDYNKIKNYCWGVYSGGYLQTSRNNKLIYFTSLIKNIDKKIHYLNQNKLDNQKENLTIGYYKRKKNNYEIFGDYTKIYIEAKEVLIDTEDLERVLKIYWTFDFHGYLCNRSDHTKFLHRYIMKCKKNEEVDHKDRDKSNNRKDNLRKCKKSENQQNKAKSKNRIYTSKYKGVDFRNGQWRCRISYENIRINIGEFSNEDAAANAYNYYAKIFHKEFACLNDVKYMEKNEWGQYLTVISNKTGYKGVTYQKNNNKWRSRIIVNKKEIILGYYNTPEEASEAYVKKYKEVILEKIRKKLNKNEKYYEFNVEEYMIHYKIQLEQSNTFD